MISDLRSRLEKEKRDDATNAKASSLTRGLDGRIVMNIKEQSGELHFGESRDDKVFI